MCAWPSASARTKNWGTEILTDADQEAQLDLLHNYFNDSLNASTGHGHTGGNSDGPKITLTTGVQGILPLANGGTGVTTLAALLNLIYPVGSIYHNYSDSTNPGTLLGFGTWVAIADRMLMALGSTFATPQGTGGAATVTLDTTMIPAHSHVEVFYQTGGGSGNGPANGQSATATNGASTQNTGGGLAHENMPPYITVYVWRRTV